MTGGSYTINVSGHGFIGQEHIAIADGVFDITCGKDGGQQDPSAEGGDGQSA